MSNFEFIEKHFSDLARLGKFAEEYLYSDPQSSLIKLRLFSEQVVKFLYKKLSISPPSSSYKGFIFSDYLDNPAFKKRIDSAIINRLHLIRQFGNEAAHVVKEFDPHQVIQILHYSHTLAQWLYKIFVNKDEEFTQFVIPKKEKAETKLIEDKTKEINQIIETINKTEEKEVITETQAEKILEGSQKCAESLGMTEAQTRKELIDKLLDSAGWFITKTYDESSGKPQAIEEFPVEFLTTNKSGKGSIDYVLMGKNGNPIALIEAKKTSESPEKGKTQAEDYANGLEKKYKQRPFIFYTNGKEIFFWDDKQYPPRKIWNYFDLDKLEYMLLQRTKKKIISGMESSISIDTSIAGRPYQLAGIRKVYEDFEINKKQKALIVMATGTGKTRMTVALIDGLMRANWAKRILFLVDRIELGRQAAKAFREFMPNEKVVVATSKLKEDETKDARIYISTYQTMNNLYSNFNAGFFDVLIADESHRSIYNAYLDIFRYFDSLQIGLTATPIDYINRNTFTFFELTEGVPTFNYDYFEAINNIPPYLVNFQTDESTTQFIQRGIKYNEFTEEQRSELEEAGEAPENFEYEKSQVNKNIFNKETCRIILKDLMDKGIKDSTGTKTGKTIVFARNQKHAELLVEVFNELYPQYKGKNARAIHYAESKAQYLIDGFKGDNDEFKDVDIAISVDMLDTGIDVPEVVNLVFAKPIMSKVKFWQMIGRGTRLCPNLFGKGKDKTHFLIFDYYENFAFFDLKPEGIKPSVQVSLPERVFRNELEIFKAVLSLDTNQEIRDNVQEKLRKSISQLPETSISVKEKWKDLEKINQDLLWNQKTDELFELLNKSIASLMRWKVDENSTTDALSFDNKILKTQLALIQKDQNEFEKHKLSILEEVSKLRTNLNQVQKEIKLINNAQTEQYWENIDYFQLEDLRLRLRPLMQYKKRNENDPKIIDILEKRITLTTKTRTGEGYQSPFELEKYKEKFIAKLKELADQNLVIQKIRRGKKVTPAELEHLRNLIIQSDPDFDMECLTVIFQDKINHLDKLIREILGMDELTVKEYFDEFRSAHNNLKSAQIQFLTLLEQQIIKAGGIEIEELYKPPFSQFHSRGIEGVFNGETNEIIQIIRKLTG